MVRNLITQLPPAPIPSQVLVGSCQLTTVQTKSTPVTKVLNTTTPAPLKTTPTTNESPLASFCNNLKPNIPSRCSSTPAPPSSSAVSGLTDFSDDADESIINYNKSSNSLFDEESDTMSEKSMAWLTEKR